jgi:hypothetical protein
VYAKILLPDSQPWRILWRGLTLQMTRKTPLRRIILQCSQRLRMDGVTFIVLLLRFEFSGKSGTPPLDFLENY